MQDLKDLKIQHMHLSILRDLDAIVNLLLHLEVESRTEILATLSDIQIQLGQIVRDYKL